MYIFKIRHYYNYYYYYFYIQYGHWVLTLPAGFQRHPEYLCKTSSYYVQPGCPAQQQLGIDLPCTIPQIVCPNPNELGTCEAVANAY